MSKAFMKWPQYRTQVPYARIARHVPKNSPEPTGIRHSNEGESATLPCTVDHKNSYALAVEDMNYIEKDIMWVRISYVMLCLLESNLGKSTRSTVYFLPHAPHCASGNKNSSRYAIHWNFFIENKSRQETIAVSADENGRWHSIRWFAEMCVIMSERRWISRLFAVFSLDMKMQKKERWFVVGALRRKKGSFWWCCCSHKVLMISKTDRFGMDGWLFRLSD